MVDVSSTTLRSLNRGRIWTVVDDDGDGHADVVLATDILDSSSLKKCIVSGGSVGGSALTVAICSGQLVWLGIHVVVVHRVTSKVLLADE